MTLFRSLLTFMFLSMLGYTLITISNEGFGFVPVFFGDLLQFGWRGQFDLDFATYLLLASLWIMWRKSFQPSAVALGLFAPWLGMTFFAAYLLYLTVQTQGDMRRLLLGDHVAV